MSLNSGHPPLGIAELVSVSLLDFGKRETAIIFRTPVDTRTCDGTMAAAVEPITWPKVPLAFSWVWLAKNEGLDSYGNPYRTPII